MALEDFFIEIITAIPSMLLAFLYMPGLMIDYLWGNFVMPLYAAVYAVVDVVLAFSYMLTSFLEFVAWLPAPILALIALYISTFVVLVIARIVLKIIATIWPGRGWLE